MLYLYLQVHIQTIGILVAEKTELQSSLGQSQKLATQRTGMLNISLQFLFWRKLWITCELPFVEKFQKVFSE